jgi:hypothetical protein
MFFVCLLVILSSSTNQCSGEISFELKDPAYCYVILKKPDDLNTLAANVTKWLSEVESSKVGCLSLNWSSVILVLTCGD